MALKYGRDTLDPARYVGSYSSDSPIPVPYSRSLLAYMPPDYEIMTSSPPWMCSRPERTADYHHVSR